MLDGWLHRLPVSWWSWTTAEMRSTCGMPAWESFLSLLRASVRRARAVEQKRAGRIMRPGSCAGDRRGTRTHLMGPVLCFETGRSERDARRGDMLRCKTAAQSQVVRCTGQAPRG